MTRSARRTLVYVWAVLLATVLLATGCTCVGTAGVSTTSDEGPVATTTPPTVAASARQQQRLEQARDVLQARQTGAKLFISTPLADDYVNGSHLVVHGRVTGVRPITPAPESAATNSYVGIWVEADEVLKGSAQHDGPFVFALLTPAEGEPEPPLAVGDEVLCFSSRGDERLQTDADALGCYFFWNDTYGIFLPVGDKFVNALSPFAFTSLHEVRALVGPKGTSTTLPPGYLPFEGKAARFEDRVTGKRLPGTLPYEILASADLDWLPDAIGPNEMTIAKGYRFDNGDLVFLWETPWVGASHEERESAIVQGLESAAMERYGATDKQVWAFWSGEFGYLVISQDNVATLGSLAQMAQTGQPLK